MPSFKHTLLGLGPICDSDCKEVFTKGELIIYDTAGATIISGWRKRDGARLWYILLKPEPGEIPNLSQDAPATPSQACSAYDIPSAEALVCYFHAATGFAARDKWLKAIKDGNCITCPGLNLDNYMAYCPSSDVTLKGHMVQSRQGVISTNPNPCPSKTDAVVTKPADNQMLPSVRSNKIHIHVRHISKIQNDDCGRLPVRARSGNQYVMVA